jgi:hypothetical protein
MADMCKAKLRVPRQLAPVRRDGAFQAGNAPYSAKRISGGYSCPFVSDGCDEIEGPHRDCEQRI